MRTDYIQFTKAHSVHNFIKGLGLCLFLAVCAKLLSELPYFGILGQLVIAILLGMGWRGIFGMPAGAEEGAAFAGKKLLRYGIILLGMRLNLSDIAHAGFKVFLLVILQIAFTLAVMLGLARLLKLDPGVGLLTACGTAICGAAAVAAISPQIKANDEETATAVATVALLGTVWTFVYTLSLPWLGLSSAGYGVFAGASLHEIAHVIAAAGPAGREALDLAVVVKLTRVAMLVPVALGIGFWDARKRTKKLRITSNEVLTVDKPQPERARWREIPVPWFILGFLFMSGLNTLKLIPTPASDAVVTGAYQLMAMAMAGLGLGVNAASLIRKGVKPLAAGVIGSVLLSGFVYGLIAWFRLG
ncbi:YeiH family putative sulfate export transporter [Paenibacillus sp. HN-1]|uniref:YeiH family protein n=1 Tax=Paenibacillus TaxID=44249 RepID=UPI001CA8F5CE|nr:MULTISPECIES: YeiH family protein [Paenibacillus]MBY9080264.1 YeiH family putative sulfate export transporter [Paenibacillus sp. CGMCC 1.18879]MBY9083077.1 YeiH family putative sulfate export transporter [Paenibacillus sinensis]